MIASKNKFVLLNAAFILPFAFLISCLVHFCALSAEPADSPNDQLTICYFSFNSTAERPLLESFVNKLESKQKIKIIEVMSRSKKPTDALDELVSKNIKCDGVVFSGHHTGSFYGANSNGTLKIEDLEKLSCDPKYISFFYGVKALWLQGCNTLGNDVSQFRNERMRNADQRAANVFRHREHDGAEQSLLEMSYEFSATMDSSNPLGTRYLRVFPQAKVFGWRGTAPSNRDDGEYMLLYHIANTAHLLAGKTNVYSNPKNNNFDPESIAAYQRAIEALLSPKSSPGESEQCEKAAIEGWNWAGKAPPDASKKGYIGVHNPAAKGIESLISNGNSDLATAREFQCSFKNENSCEGIQKTMKVSFSDRKKIGLNLPTALSRMQTLVSSDKESDRVLAKCIQSQLRELPEVESYVLEMMKAENTGLLRKLELAATFHSLYQKEIPEALKEEIREDALSYIGKDQERAPDDLQLTLSQLLEKAGLLNYKTSKAILDRKVENVRFLDFLSSQGLNALDERRADFDALFSLLVSRAKEVSTVKLLCDQLPETTKTSDMAFQAVKKAILKNGDPDRIAWLAERDPTSQETVKTWVLSIENRTSREKVLLGILQSNEPNESKFLFYESYLKRFHEGLKFEDERVIFQLPAGSNEEKNLRNGLFERFLAAQIKADRLQEIHWSDAPLFLDELNRGYTWSPKMEAIFSGVKDVKTLLTDRMCKIEHPVRPEAKKLLKKDFENAISSLSFSANEAYQYAACAKRNGAESELKEIALKVLKNLKSKKHGGLIYLLSLFQGKDPKVRDALSGIFARMNDKELGDSPLSVQLAAFETGRVAKGFSLNRGRGTSDIDHLISDSLIEKLSDSEIASYYGSSIFEANASQRNSKINEILEQIARLNPKTGISLKNLLYKKIADHDYLDANTFANLFLKEMSSDDSEILRKNVDALFSKLQLPFVGLSEAESVSLLAKVFDALVVKWNESNGDTNRLKYWGVKLVTLNGQLKYRSLERSILEASRDSASLLTAVALLAPESDIDIFLDHYLLPGFLLSRPVELRNRLCVQLIRNTESLPLHAANRLFKTFTYLEGNGVDRSLAGKLIFGLGKKIVTLDSARRDLYNSYSGDFIEGLKSYVTSPERTETDLEILNLATQLFHPDTVLRLRVDGKADLPKDYFSTYMYFGRGLNRQGVISSIERGEWKPKDALKMLRRIELSMRLYPSRPVGAFNSVFESMGAFIVQSNGDDSNLRTVNDLYKRIRTQKKRMKTILGQAQEE